MRVELMAMNQVKYHYNHWLPKLLKADGVTIGRDIFFLDSNPPLHLIKHELVHVKQYEKHGLIGFLVIYLYHYLKGRLKGRSHFEAYYDIPFEVEARKGELS